MRRGSVMVRRGSVMVRRGSVGSASAGPSSIFGSEQTSDEEMERGLSEWRWINVLYAVIE
jgi:hypothetical protein